MRVLILLLAVVCGLIFPVVASKALEERQIACAPNGLYLSILKKSVKRPVAYCKWWTSRYVDMTYHF